MKDSTDSFIEIAMPHLDVVYRTAFAMCSSRDDAEDLTQATFLKAFESFRSFSKGTNCKAWLLSILRNKWIDLVRHRNVVGQVSQIDENIIAAKEQNEEIRYSNCEDLLENFSDEQIIKALRTLPAEKRFALFLVDVEQLSHEEAADIMNVPVGTIKSRTSRARAVLRTILFSHAKEMGFTGGER
ncbi:MAG: sigma-70 family RNA polymerase sigma factor [Planctomycetota bacterium]